MNSVQCVCVEVLEKQAEHFVKKKSMWLLYIDAD